MLHVLSAVQNHAKRSGSSPDLKKYVSQRTMSLQLALVKLCQNFRRTTYGINPPISKPSRHRIVKYCAFVCKAHCDALTIDHAQIMVGIHRSAPSFLLMRPLGSSAKRNDERKICHRISHNSNTCPLVGGTCCLTVVEVVGTHLYVCKSWKMQKACNILRSFNMLSEIARLMFLRFKSSAQNMTHAHSVILRSSYMSLSLRAR